MAKMITEYYYEKLSLLERKGYQAFLEAIIKKESEVHLPIGIQNDRTVRILDMVGLDHPELFYVDFHEVRYFCSPIGIKCTLTYLDKEPSISEKQRKIEKVVSNLMKMARNANLKNDFVKARWIHDRLVRNIVYNREAVSALKQHPDAYSIEGVLLNKRAVCEGIAKTYKLLADRLGVYAVVAIGESQRKGERDKEPHGWNIVKIQDKYYQIDATWDGNLSLSSQHFRYDYFCLSDREMQRDHNYDGYPKCKEETMTYFKQQSREFQKKKQLIQYVKEESKSGKSYLYFKITEGSFLDCGDDLLQAIQEILLEELPEGRSYEMEFNEDQKILFVRLSGL